MKKEDLLFCENTLGKHNSHIQLSISTVIQTYNLILIPEFDYLYIIQLMFE